MFKINGSKNYKILRVKGGKGQKNEYTFLTVEGEINNGQKFPEKLKINLWGKNFDGTIAKGDYIKILGANSIGNVSSQDRNDPNKWYQSLTIDCEVEHVQLVEKETSSKVEASTELSPVETREDLPF